MPGPRDVRVREKIAGVVSDLQLLSRKSENIPTEMLIFLEAGLIQFQERLDTIKKDAGIIDL